MKKGRSWVAALLAVTMLAVLLTGCGPKIDVTKYSQPGAQVQSPAVGQKRRGQRAGHGQRRPRRTVLCQRHGIAHGDRLQLRENGLEL